MSSNYSQQVFSGFRVSQFFKLSFKIKIIPADDPEAYLNRGVAYTGVNKITEARRDFQKAAEQDPSGEEGQKGRRGIEMLKGY
ncbi:MAG: hypothetical protein GY797_06310 [Deltaproteobacteria bacterium]|nr:hypothetical protein [Deltaproteobacteria bacterium]